MRKISEVVAHCSRNRQLDDWSKPPKESQLAERQCLPGQANRSGGPAHGFNQQKSGCIKEQAIAAVKSLGSARAMELFKDLEEKKDQVQNPSGYLKAAVKREPHMARGPMVMAPMAQRTMAFAADPQKVQKRATWLNANVFPDRPIDQEAVMMMTSLGTARAMELFKDVEEKKEQVRNPSGYLKTAAARDAPMQQVYHSNGDDGKIHRRATWLNSNVFQDRPIDQEAIQALTTVGTARAMALYKDVEEKQEQVKNPSGYLKTAVARDGGGGYVAAPAAQGQHMQSEREEQSKIQKRITWLNANVFPDRQIDTEATGAMFGLGISRAFELLKEVEGKAQELRNPTGYLKTAAIREGLVPPEGHGGQAAVQSSNQEDKVSRRARWLNENLFPDRPIDQEAIAAMSSLDMPRAMELFKDVEEKAAQLRNPGGYLKVAVSREGTGPGPMGGATPRSAIYAQPGQQGIIPAGDKLQRRSLGPVVAASKWRETYRQLFQEADKDNNGFLDIAEVKLLLRERLKALSTAEAPEEDAATTATRSEDAGGRDRIHMGMEAAGMGEYIDHCIEQADVNRDGRIDIDEFVHLMVLHLPDARIAADAEFVTDQRRCIAEWSGERAQRLLTIILNAAADRSAARRLVSCLMITLGAGMVEGSLLVNWAHANAGGRRGWWRGFVLRYAVEQLLPSLIWCTQDASLVAEAMGFEPQALLKNLEGREGASTLLAVGQCHAVRSVSAGFNLLGQLFRFTQITNNVLKQFEQKVRLGKDVPLSSGAKERVIRLCGEFSYATYAAAAKSGRFHILAVMDPGNMPMLTEQLTHGFKYPLFLNVPTKLWGQPDVWEPLLGRAVQPSWLLQGVAGNKVLCVEVDGTERHEILLFGRVRKIGIEQASNAFRAISFVMLRSLASQGLPSSSIQLLRVYLGDSHELSTTGGLARFTCRERVESRREADVLVDFHAPILRRLRLWALDNAVDQVEGEALPTICFEPWLQGQGHETTCPERFQNLAHLMRDTAQVVDQVQAVKLCKQLNTPIPRLIHYPSTAETVNAAYALARPGEVTVDVEQKLPMPKEY
eukprot:s194_g54.t1